MKSNKYVVQNINDSIFFYEKNLLIKNYNPKYNLKKSYEYFDQITKKCLEPRPMFVD